VTGKRTNAEFGKLKNIEIYLSLYQYRKLTTNENLLISPGPVCARQRKLCLNNHEE
jgi:hypothetical protein